MSLSKRGRKIHKCILDKASKYYSENGYTVFKEAKMSGRDRIDLLAIKGQEKVGIECQLTISYKIIRQKFRDYNQNLTKMVFIVPVDRKKRIDEVLGKIASEEDLSKNFFEVWTENVATMIPVRISKKTKQLLDEVGKEIGSFGDTYDDIIFKVLKKMVKNNGASR
ncbi:MAG: hypothetical protein AABX14_04745 [Candidatus Aenigmatarchaeota archaeon]